MSKTLNKFLEDLRDAEFGNETVERNPQLVVKLLKRALKWKTQSRLEDVCAYLGYEDDTRIETIDGCKDIIKENIEAFELEKE